MRGFRAGTFSRDTMPGALRRFSPASSLDRVEQVDLGAMKAAGKKLVLLDVDNTLLPWRHHEFEKPVLDWIAAGKAMGLQFCILSNTRHPERLKRLCEALGVTCMRARFKPSRQMYDMALAEFKVSPDEAVMVGDQLLTDVWGANRAGIDAVWIRPVAQREFIGTRLLSRNVERFIGRMLHNYFSPSDAGTITAKPGFFEHSTVRQFAKFCVVGGLSTVIDLGTHWLLLFVVKINGVPLSHTVGTWFWNLTHAYPALQERDIFDSAYGPLKVPAVALAILNSYYWNRRWTFRVDSSHGHASMITKFYVVAIVGMILNVVVGASVNRLMHFDEGARWAGASMIGVVVAVFWNFFGQKLWTFKKVAK